MSTTVAERAAERGDKRPLQVFVIVPTLALLVPTLVTDTSAARTPSSLRCETSSTHRGSWSH